MGLDPTSFVRKSETITLAGEKIPLANPDNPIKTGLLIGTLMAGAVYAVFQSAIGYLISVYDAVSQYLNGLESYLWNLVWTYFGGAVDELATVDAPAIYGELGVFGWPLAVATALALVYIGVQVVA